MTGTNTVKIVADGEPEEENSMTSWCGQRRVSRLHLCVIYGLLGVYGLVGLWALASYETIRTGLLDELAAASRRGGAAPGELGHATAPVDDWPSVSDVADMPSLSRVQRDAARRRGNRPRGHSSGQRSRTPPAQSRGDSDTQPRRRQHSRRSGRRREQPRRTSRQSQMGTTIHMHAQQDVDKQFTSNAMVSFNSSGDTTYRLWRKADWLSADSQLLFTLNEETGHVTVLQSGVYLIYAQMVYHDRTGRWSFGVYVDSSEVVKCLSSEQLRDARSLHPTSHGVYQQCNTVTTVRLRQHQSLYVRCMYGARTVLTQPEFSFWGVVKLS